MRISALVILAIVSLPSQALAQAYQCRVPQNISVPKVSPDGPRRSVPVSGYTLALSWSPDFCRGRELQARNHTQCSGRNGRFGLIVHGLWPEGRGTWPQWCQTAHSVSPVEARRNMCMTPSAPLMARQWAKHGSCMVSKPETYFKVSRILWNSLRIPDYDRLSRKDGLTAGDIRNAFADANAPHLLPEHIGVKLDRHGWLEELRLCYGKKFMPTRCDERRRGASNDEVAKIWRGL